MRRDLLSSSSKDDRRMSEMDSAILRILERLVGQLIQNTWQDLTSSLGIDGEPLDFSGVHPLGAARLVPYLDQAGVFLIFGPLPEVRILHLGASRIAMHTLLNAALIPGSDWRWGWRWEAEPSPAPTYAACVSMEDNWSLIAALKSLLAQYLAPLQSVQKCPGEQTAFT
jgi:hypothetical protein